MIPDVHLQKSLHLIKSSPGLRTRQAWGPLVYYQRGLCHSHQLLWLSWRRSWRLHKGEVLAASSRAFIHTATRGCSRVIHVSTSGWSARRSTTWIIRTLVGRSSILRTYVWRKRRTTSQWRCQFNEKVDCVSWFERLIRKLDLKDWSESQKVD